MDRSSAYNAVHRLLGAIGLTVGVLALAVGCAEGQPPAGEDPDAGVADVDEDHDAGEPEDVDDQDDEDADVDPGDEQNDCGGTEPLEVDGKEVAPGDVCGPCDEGEYVCVSDNEVECTDAAGTNACGGCGDLEAVPGESCFDDDDGDLPVGVWECEGEEQLVCNDELNPCGGSQQLDDLPGDECTDDGEVYECDGDDSVRCCPSGEDRVVIDDSSTCTASCDVDDDCDEDAESCIGGYCIAEDIECMVDDDCDDADDMICEDYECVPDICEPEPVCEDYCHEKFGRCMDQQCEGFTTTVEHPDTGQDVTVDLDPDDIAELEVETCMEGVEGEDGETWIEGCVEAAEADESACDEFEEQADVYANQPCGEDDQEIRRCREMTNDVMTLVGDEIYEHCGCESAQTVEACSTDADCDEYGYAECIDGMCVASCVDPFEGAEDEDIPTFFPPDGYCGTESDQFCMLWPRFVGQALPGMPDNTCMQFCEAKSDCPMGDDSACVPLGGEDDDGNQLDPIGFCDTPNATFFEPILGLEDVTPDQLCVDDAECSDGHCYEGSCQPECDGEDDDEACSFGDCVDFSDGNDEEDYRCNVTFVELEGED